MKHPLTKYDLHDMVANIVAIIKFDVFVVVFLFYVSNWKQDLVKSTLINLTKKCVA